MEDIVIEPAYDRETTKFIMNRVSFKAGDSIDFRDLEKTVRKIYGTRNFVKVYYILEPQKNGNYIVKLKAEQDVKFRLKGALHYDSELGASFVFNANARNWLRKGEVISATLDLAELPKWRIQYKKYKKQSNSSFNVELFREQTIQTTRDNNGRPTADFKNTYRSFNMGRNFNLGIPASFYFGFIAELSEFRPKYNSDYQNTIYSQQFFKDEKFESDIPNARLL